MRTTCAVSGSHSTVEPPAGTRLAQVWAVVEAPQSVALEEAHHCGASRFLPWFANSVVCTCVVALEVQFTKG